MARRRTMGMKDVETAKNIVDAASIGVVASTVLAWLPAIATSLSIVWFLIRIWESKTARYWPAPLSARYYFAELGTGHMFDVALNKTAAIHKVVGDL